MRLYVTILNVGSRNMFKGILLLSTKNGKKSGPYQLVLISLKQHTCACQHCYYRLLSGYNTYIDLILPVLKFSSHDANIPYFWLIYSLNNSSISIFSLEPCLSCCSYFVEWIVVFMQVPNLSLFGVLMQIYIIVAFFFCA